MKESPPEWNELLFVLSSQASNITTPNGSLEVCYDERGSQYKVPQYCTANPIELNNDSTLSISAPSLTASATIIPAGENKSNKTSTSAKTTSTNNAPVTVRVRINPGDDFYFIFDIQTKGNRYTFHYVLFR